MEPLGHPGQDNAGARPPTVRRVEDSFYFKARAWSESRKPSCLIFVRNWSLIKTRAVAGGFVQRQNTGILYSLETARREEHGGQTK